MCRPKTKDAHPEPEGSVGGGSGLQSPRPVAAKDRQRAGKLQGDRPLVCAGRGPTHVYTYQVRPLALTATMEEYDDGRYP